MRCHNCDHKINNQELDLSNIEAYCNEDCYKELNEE